MAEQPKYDFKKMMYSPAPSPGTTYCNCCNNAVTNQQCPKCIHNPNINVHWPSAPSIGFNHPNRPVYHNPPFSHSLTNPHRPPAYYPSTNPARPPSYTPTTQCPTCHSYSCSGHAYRPTSVVPKPFTQPPREGSKSYYWVDTFSHGGIPSTAIQGGHDIDGARIFVGRAFHEGDWIPAKVIPDRNVAYVAYDGGEHAKHQYQVLCEQRFDWIHSSGGHVPPGAVEGGKTVDGEPLYVGRVHHSGAITVGKIHPSHGVCYIPFDGKEIGHHEYEILVLRN